MQERLNYQATEQESLDNLIADYDEILSDLKIPDGFLTSETEAQDGDDEVPLLEGPKDS